MVAHTELELSGNSETTTGYKFTLFSDFERFADVWSSLSESNSRFFLRVAIFGPDHARNQKSIFEKIFSNFVPGVLHHVNVQHINGPESEHISFIIRQINFFCSGLYRCLGTPERNNQNTTGGWKLTEIPNCMRWCLVCCDYEQRLDIDSNSPCDTWSCRLSSHDLCLHLDLAD